jgi:hypothetical protein
LRALIEAACHQRVHTKGNCASSSQLVQVANVLQDEELCTCLSCNAHARILGSCILHHASFVQNGRYQLCQLDEIHCHDAKWDESHWNALQSMPQVIDCTKMMQFSINVLVYIC